MAVGCAETVKAVGCAEAVKAVGCAEAVKAVGCVGTGASVGNVCARAASGCSSNSFAQGRVTASMARPADPHTRPVMRKNSRRVTPPAAGCACKVGAGRKTRRAMAITQRPCTNTFSTIRPSVTSETVTCAVTKGCVCSTDKPNQVEMSNPLTRMMLKPNNRAASNSVYSKALSDALAKNCLQTAHNQLQCRNR